MAIQQGRPQNRIILTIGIILAIVAGVLFFLGLTKGIGGTGGPTEDVYVAANDIAAGTALTQDLFLKESAPQNVVPLDVVTDLSTVTGKTAPIGLTKNQILTQSFLNAQVGPGGTAIGVSSLPIAPGYVAMAIPVNGVGSGGNATLMTIGGYIQAGDHIDMMADFGGATSTDHDIKYFLQDVHVLKVGGAPAASSGQAAGPVVPSYLIVELPRNQAEILTAFTSGMAGTNQGLVKFVLRPVSEWGKPDKNGYFTAPKYEDATGVPIPTVNDPGITPQQLQNQFK